MEMFCPECMSPMNTQDGATAICAAHNAEFSILFSRYPTVVTATLAEESDETAPDRTIPFATPNDAAAGRLTQAFGGEAAPMGNCSRHPQSRAVTRCHVCRAPICSTCLFVFPGGLHLCPACASNPNPQISPKRKRMIWWSAGLGVLSLVGLASMLMIAAALRGQVNAEALGMGVIVFSLLPAIVGMAMGVGALDRRLKTPGFVWVGIICNGVGLIIWILLTIVGLMK